MQEELLEVRGPWWTAPGKTAGAIAIVLCTVLAAGLVIVLLQRDHPRSVAKRPAAGAPAAAIGDAAIEQIPARCPAGQSCRVTSSVPAEVSAAVAQGLPGGLERAHYSVLQSTPRELVYRSVNATVGLVELLVIVSKAPPSQRAEATRYPPGATIAYVRDFHDGFEVQVQFTGPPGYTPPMNTARALAADPRLLVLT